MPMIYLMLTLIEFIIMPEGVPDIEVNMMSVSAIARLSTRR